MHILLSLMLVPGQGLTPQEAEGFPPLFLARGLPAHGVCCTFSGQSNASFVCLVEGKSSAGPWDVVDAFIRATIWNSARLATDPNYDRRLRRVALYELIQWAGERAVVTGELPPPIALHRFKPW